MGDWGVVWYKGGLGLVDNGEGYDEGRELVRSIGIVYRKRGGVKEGEY